MNTYSTLDSLTMLRQSRLAASAIHHISGSLDLPSVFCQILVLRIYTPSRQHRSSSDTCILDGNLRLKRKPFDKDHFYMPTKILFYMLTKILFICRQRSFSYADKILFICRQRSFLYADKDPFHMPTKIIFIRQFCDLIQTSIWHQDFTIKKVIQANPFYFFIFYFLNASV